MTQFEKLMDKIPGDKRKVALVTAWLMLALMYAGSTFLLGIAGLTVYEVLAYGVRGAGIEDASDSQAVTLGSTLSLIIGGYTMFRNVQFTKLVLKVQRETKDLTAPAVSSEVDWSEYKK